MYLDLFFLLVYVIIGGGVYFSASIEIIKSFKKYLLVGGNMKKIAVLVSIVLLLSFSACDDFFTSSYGERFAREYNPDNININSGNVNDWIRRATGNAGLALAVSGKIKSDLEGFEGDIDPATAALIDGGVKLAIEASGVGASIVNNVMSNVDSLISGAEPDESITQMEAILLGIQDDFQNKNGKEASSNLAAILGHAITGKEEGGIPVLDPEYINKSSPNDVAFGVIVLTLGIIEDAPDFRIEDVEDIEEWGSFVTDVVTGLRFNADDHRVTVDTSTGAPSDEALALAAYFNLFMDAPDDFMNGVLTGPLGKMFLNLQP